jgi:type IV pilus assembly protein PilN
MPHINLLPWRETITKERQIRFSIATGTALALTAATMLGVHLYIEGLISYQQRRNQFLEAEIKKVMEQIEEIKTLTKKKQRLVDRQNAIQNLDAERPKVVHLFDEIVKQVPEGVYFTSMEQKKDVITLKGVAQSEARVSTLMKNIEKSEWLKNPSPKEIKSSDEFGKDGKTKRSASTFELQMTQKSPVGEEEESGATTKSTPPKPGDKK